MWFVKWILLVAMMQFLDGINCRPQICDHYPQCIGEKIPPEPTKKT